MIFLLNYCLRSNKSFNSSGLMCFILFLIRFDVTDFFIDFFQNGHFNINALVTQTTIFEFISLSHHLRVY
jgi:hypothetical protein